MNDTLRRFWPHILIAAATILALFPVLSADFVQWDDPVLVFQNSLVSNFSPRVWWTFDPELYIPLVFLSFQIQHLLFGFSAFAFHAVNLLLHIGTAMILFSVLKRLTRHEIASAIGALFFALHPLAVEPAVWVSARKELLMAFFTLLSLLLFLRDEEEGHHSWGSVVAFLCALLSKVTAVMLPVALVILLFMKDGKINRRSQSALLPFFGLSILFGVIALLGKQYTVGILPLSSVILLSAKSLLFYIGKLLWPLQLSAIYPAPASLTLSDPMTIAAMLTSIAIVVLTIILLRRGRLAGWAMSLSILFLLPSFLSYQKSNVVMLAADRYMYLSLAGVALLIALLIQKIDRRSVIIVSGIILVVLGFLSNARSRVWADTETLFMDVLETYPNEPIALNNIGFLHLQVGNLPGATEYFRKALAGNPRYPDALTNLGAAEAKAGDLDAAKKSFEKALEIDPTHLQAAHSLAGISYVRGDYVIAEKQYETALAINPEFTSSLFQLARTKLRLGKREEAKDVYQKLLSIDQSYEGRDAALNQLLQ